MTGVLTLGSLDPAFDLAHSVQSSPVELDLRAVEFVEPAGLCGLAALLEFLTARSDNVSVALSGRNVAAYLERMDFFRLFSGRVEVYPDMSSLEERERHNPGTLQELVNFHEEEEIKDIIQRISDILEGREYFLRERVAICSTLSEVCGNAAEHGRSSFGAYVAVQAYDHIVSGSRRDGEEVIISIADGGPGIRQTLTRNPAYGDHTGTDNEAIRHALQMGVTSTAEIGRGGGLTLVAQLSARSGGSLSIRSGSGRVTVNKEEKQRPRNVPDFPGTFVRVSLPRLAGETRRR